MKHKELLRVISSAFLFMIALFLPSSLLQVSLFIISYLIVGIDVIFHAIRGFGKNFLLDEHFLMSLATIGAFLIGEYKEAVMVMILYQVGELFTDHATEKSEEEISKLMAIRPDYANLVKNGKEKKVSPDEVKVDDVILIKSGEKIPLDGVILEGESILDTSSLTGEALPQPVVAGDVVLSGSVNLSGSLTVRVQSEFKDSTVHKILELVKNASTKKSNSEKFITKFSKYYTPIVVLIAFTIGFIIPLLFSLEFQEYIERALIFLVISCPCALVISVPLGFFSGIGGASRSGILIKGSHYLERLAHINCFVFDKTGTLTKGTFEVVDIISLGMSQEEILYYASCSERDSSHPIALSIKKYYGKDISKAKIKNVQELSGFGTTALVDNREVIVGNYACMLKNDILCEEFQNDHTTIYVAVDKKVGGVIFINDVVKEEASSAILELKKLGSEKFVMLTGDKEAVASHISQQLKLDDYYAELLPDDKVAKVESLLKDYHVAFVGDGINDAPVLAICDVGISMGRVGSDAAIEASDIVIMTDQLKKLPQAVKISRKTLRIVKQNIVFALTVKFLILLLGAFGLANMWFAVIADVGVSILAILNSMRAFQL